MSHDFKVGDHVEWISEAGKVRGTIKKKHTSEITFKGYTVRASKEAPQYEIKSDKTDHLAMHKGSVLTRVAKKQILIWLPRAKAIHWIRGVYPYQIQKSAILSVSHESASLWMSPSVRLSSQVSKLRPRSSNRGPFISPAKVSYLAQLLLRHLWNNNLGEESALSAPSWF